MSERRLARVRAQNDYAHRGDAACNWQLLCCWAENGPLVMSKPVTLMPTTIAIGYLRRLALGC
jgi:hypothetical protein